MRTYNSAANSSIVSPACSIIPFSVHGFIQNSSEAHQRFIEDANDAAMKFFLPVCVALFSAASVSAEPEPPATPELSRASVTLPYTELRSLWEAAHRIIPPEAAATPDIAPVANVVHRADCLLRLGESSSRIEAQFEVEALSAQWQSVPLIGGAARLEHADSEEQPVIAQDGHYTLLTNGAGRKSVSLQMTTAGTRSIEARRPLVLWIGEATVRQLRVEGVPVGREARVDGEAPVAIENGVALFHLEAAAGEVRVELVDAQIAAPPAQPTQSHWTAAAQALVRHADGRLEYMSRIFFHADDGSGMEIILEIPRNAVAVTVAGPDLESWNQVRADDGRRLVRVQWTTRDLLDRELAVAYAVPQSPLADAWNLQSAAIADGGETRTFFAIVPSEGLELSGDPLRTAVDSRRLPEWLRAQIQGADFVTAESGSQLALQTTWLPAVSTAEAIVTEAKCAQRLVADGSMQTTVHYTIRHQAPLRFRLALPADVEVLTCTLGGESARPIQREGGTIELSLQTPEGQPGAASVFALTYTSKSPPLDPVSGRIMLSLPQTPLFIDRLDWQIGLPNVFEITAIDGNVAVAAPAERQPDDFAIAMRKDFIRAERPVVELFYQRRALAN